MISRSLDIHSNNKSNENAYDLCLYKLVLIFGSIYLKLIFKTIKNGSQ